MKGGIAVIDIKDLNEYTFIVNIINPMFDALSSKLESNIKAVEDFWVESQGVNTESLHHQNRILVKRYFEQLKLLVPSLPIRQDPVVAQEFFSDYIEDTIKIIKLCEPLVGRPSSQVTINKPDKESVAPWLSPFTLAHPHLRGNYNEKPNFLEALEVLTISKETTLIGNDYWMNVNWEALQTTKR